jgi:membrane protease YdiL (CAAX protease family)
MNLDRTDNIGVRLTNEVIGISLSLGIVSELGARFKHIHKSSRDIVIAPVVEELVFRLLLLNGIRTIQNIYSGTLSAEQQGRQRTFRYLASGILFGLAHLSNDDITTMRVVLHSISGIIYSYISERYTTGGSILAHSLHNIGVICRDENISRIPHILTSIVKTIFIFMFFLKTITI